MMDAIVTAGGIPLPGEPLFEYTQGEAKAMLDIAGKPMIQWVLDALCGAQQVDHIVIVGLTEEAGLHCAREVSYIPNAGDMVANIRAGVAKIEEVNPAAHHILVVSSDIPGITAEMVDWVVTTTSKTDLDVYYNVITRSVMESRFPTSKRSYTRLKDIDLCGADMNVMSKRIVTTNDELWDRLVAARKNVFKQAALIGYDTLLLLLLRVINLEQAVAMVTRRLRITGQAVVCPYAEVGMDIDKPHQLELMRADLSGRA